MIYVFFRFEYFSSNFETKMRLHLKRIVRACYGIGSAFIITLFFFKMVRIFDYFTCIYMYRSILTLDGSKVKRVDDVARER